MLLARFDADALLLRKPGQMEVRLKKTDPAYQRVVGRVAQQAESLGLLDATLLEAGFTGEITDKLGRHVHFVDGVRIKWEHDDETGQAKTSTQQPGPGSEFARQAGAGGLRDGGGVRGGAERVEPSGAPAVVATAPLIGSITEAVIKGIGKALGIAAGEVALRAARAAGRMGVTTASLLGTMLGSIVSPADYHNDSVIPALWDAFWGQGEWADTKESLDLFEAGFTGEITDKIGRHVHFRDGKRVKGPGATEAHPVQHPTLDGEAVKVLAHDPVSDRMRVQHTDGKTAVVGTDAVSFGDGDGDGAETARLAAAQKEYTHLGVHAKAFKAWFGDWDSDPENASKIVDKDGAPQKSREYSKVVDKGGEPVLVYHGTTHDFDAFDNSRANVENHIGKGFYFSESTRDVEKNYASEDGPDLHSRISQRVDELRSDIEDFFYELDRSQRRARNEEAGAVMTPEEIEARLGDFPWLTDELKNQILADVEEGVSSKDQFGYVVPLQKIAAAELTGGSPHTLECYLNIRKPVILDKDKGKGTRLELMTTPELDSEDEDAEPPDQEWGPLIQAIQHVADSYPDMETDQVQEIIEKLTQNGDEDCTAEDFLRAANDLDNPLQHENAETGRSEILNGQFAADVFKHLGFDGVIYQDASKYFTNMGIPAGTRHFVAWQPTQIKSAENRGTFDPARANIHESRDTLESFNVPTIAEINRAARETDPDPSHGRRSSGLYKKGRIRIHGLLVVIENAKGSVRRGVSENGKPWETVMSWPYGYISQHDGGSTGKGAADGEHHDCYLGPCPESEVVFVIDQQTREGEHDESKCMVGWTNARDAKEAYLAHYAPGWQGFAGIRAMTLPEFKTWLGSTADTAKKRAGPVVESLDHEPDQRHVQGMASKLLGNEKRFQADLAAWYRQIGRAITAAVAKGQPAAAAVKDSHRNKLRAILKKHMTVSALIAAKTQWRMHEDAPGAGAIAQDVQEGLLDFVKSLPAKIAGAVREAVISAVLALSPADFIEPILDRVEASARVDPSKVEEEFFSKDKIRAWAEGIAVTHNTQGANEGTTATGGILAEEGIVNAKRWLTLHGTGAIDDKVRYSHQRANGQTVGLDQDFVLLKNDGTGQTETCDRPGDSVLSAGNARNCRCLAVFVHDKAYAKSGSVAESRHLFSDRLPGSVDLLESGFTGVITDKLNRKMHFVDGKHVKGPDDPAGPEQAAPTPTLKGTPLKILSHDAATGLLRVKLENNGVVVAKLSDIDLGGKPPKPKGLPPILRQRQILEEVIATVNPDIAKMVAAEIGLELNQHAMFHPIYKNLQYRNEPGEHGVHYIKMTDEERRKATLKLVADITARMIPFLNDAGIPLPGKDQLAGQSDEPQETEEQKTARLWAEREAWKAARQKEKDDAKTFAEAHYKTPPAPETVTRTNWTAIKYRQELAQVQTDAVKIKTLDDMRQKAAAWPPNHEDTDAWDKEFARPYVKRLLNRYKYSSMKRGENQNVDGALYQVTRQHENLTMGWQEGWWGTGDTYVKAAAEHAEAVKEALKDPDFTPSEEIMEAYQYEDWLPQRLRDRKATEYRITDHANYLKSTHAYALGHLKIALASAAPKLKPLMDRARATVDAVRKEGTRLLDEASQLEATYHMLRKARDDFETQYKAPGSTEGSFSLEIPPDKNAVYEALLGDLERAKLAFFTKSPLAVNHNQTAGHQWLEPLLPKERNLKINIPVPDFLSETSKEHVAEANAFLHKAVSSSWSYLSSEMRQLPEGIYRASCGDNTINAPANISTSTIIHEFGHRIEHKDGDTLGILSRAFAMQALIDAHETPSHMGAGYDPDEIGAKDEFLDSYTGKFYHDNSSEVLSMGVQRLYEDPVGFFEGSPKHFEYTLACLHGLLTRETP